MLAAVRRALAAVIVATLACGIAEGASMEAAGQAAQAAHPVNATRRFDMPAQPLPVALTEFHRLTGASLLYDASAAEDLTANAVHAELMPAEALQRLLHRTGLVARPTSGTAFVLTRETAVVVAPDVPALPVLAPLLAVADPLERYRGIWQARVLAALCRHPKTVPGGYRLALNVWIDDYPRIARIALHPTGDAARDRLVLEALAGLDLEQAPPQRMSEPISLLLLPRPTAATGDCGQPDAATPLAGNAL